jgi:hypothetical protein
VGRTELGTPCIRPASSTIQSVLESTDSRSSLIAHICLGEASDNPTGKEFTESINLILLLTRRNVQNCIIKALLRKNRIYWRHSDQLLSCLSACNNSAGNKMLEICRQVLLNQWYQ